VQFLRPISNDKNNKAINEQLSQFWKPFEASVVPICPNPICPNHQIAREQGDNRYHLFGRTKARSLGETSLAEYGRTREGHMLSDQYPEV
jgi:hypothetical protein